MASKKLLKSPPIKKIAAREGASLIMSRSDLSQRGYKNVKKILKSENVELPSYDTVQQYVKNLDTGTLTRSFRIFASLPCFIWALVLFDTLVCHLWPFSDIYAPVFSSGINITGGHK